MKNNKKAAAYLLAAALLIYYIFTKMTSAKAKALPLIRKFEGLHTDNKDGTVSAYLDPVGIPTIGYGTTLYNNGAKVKMGDRISYQTANDELHFECDEKLKAIDQMVKVSINNNQKAALLSFTYNLGVGALQSSTLLSLLNAGKDKQTVANEFTKWVYAGGKVLNGLVIRRNEEKQLFLS